MVEDEGRKSISTLLGLLEELERGAALRDSEFWLGLMDPSLRLPEPPPYPHPSPKTQFRAGSGRQPHALKPPLATTIYNGIHQNVHDEVAAETALRQSELHKERALRRGPAQLPDLPGAADPPAEVPGLQEAGLLELRPEVAPEQEALSPEVPGDPVASAARKAHRHPLPLSLRRQVRRADLRRELRGPPPEVPLCARGDQECQVGGGPQEGVPVRHGAQAGVPRRRQDADGLGVRLQRVLPAGRAVPLPVVSLGVLLPLPAAREHLDAALPAEPPVPDQRHDPEQDLLRLLQ